MNITLNGEPRDFTPDATVLSIIEDLGLKPELVAVQLNEVIVDRKELGGITLSDGDILELIRVVGGG